VSESLGGILGGTDSVRYNGTKGGYTLGANVENLVLGSGTTGTGNALDNDITGNFLNNKLFGLAGDDILDGVLGDDTLDGGKGEDFLRGGAGSDTYIVDSVFDFVDENLADPGIDTVRSSVTFSLATGSGQAAGDVESLILTGTAAINATGSAIANTLIGNSGKNLLVGLDGDDTLNGGAGADTLEGGAGNDTYFVSSKAVQIREIARDTGDTIVSSISVDLNGVQFTEIEFVKLAGNAALNATGNDAENELTGNAVANKLAGGGAADLLEGLNGNDTLDGGTGDDTLVGGAGNDTYLVDSTSDLVSGELAGRSGGTDTVFSSAIDVTLTDNVENLVLLAGAANGRGNASNNRMIGNDTANVLLGSDGNDTLIGGGGDDELDGGTLGKDLMIGGAGDDTYYADDGDMVNESKASGGIDVVFYRGSIGYVLGANIEDLLLESSAVPVFGTGNLLDNHIDGNREDNKLRGLAGEDSLTGGGGNDTLDGGSGADRMDGGIGDDLYIVDNPADEVRESIAGGYDTVESFISFNLTDNGTTVRGEFEALRLTGSAAINGTGNALSNVISGNSGANTLDGGEGLDTLEGGAGNDSLIGGDDFDLLLGGSGNDRLTGGGDESVDALNGGVGADTMDGDGGNDIYHVDNAKDVIIEASDLPGGIDTVYATVSYTLPGNVERMDLHGRGAVTGVGNGLANIVSGSEEANKLFGLDGDDSVLGEGGNDTLDGGIGNDTMGGGFGNDTYHVDSVFDVIRESVNFADGVDTVITTVSYSLAPPEFDNIENLTLASGAGDIAGTGNGLANIITGNERDNDIRGADGNDTVFGGSGIDFLGGGAGNDSLNGGIGDDFLIGSDGDDTMDGGTGKDTFFYDSVLDGHDLIRGFDGNAAGGQDVLDMEALFDNLGTATADRIGRIQVIDRGANVNVRVDTDGNGAFDLFVATLQSSNAITAGADIVVGTL